MTNKFKRSNLWFKAPHLNKSITTCRNKLFPILINNLHFFRKINRINSFLMTTKTTNKRWILCCCYGSYCTFCLVHNWWFKLGFKYYCRNYIHIYYYHRINEKFKMVTTSITNSYVHFNGNFKFIIEEIATFLLVAKI
jgi:hypothetical protein